MFRFILSSLALAMVSSNELEAPAELGVQSLQISDDAKAAKANIGGFVDESKSVVRALGEQLSQFETFLEGPGAALKPDLDPALDAMKRAFKSGKMDEIAAAQGILDKVMSKLSSLAEF